MSASFSENSSNFLGVNLSSNVSKPLTFSVWFKTSSVSTQMAICTIQVDETTGARNYRGITTPGQKVRIVERQDDPVLDPGVNSSSDYVSNSWNHCLFVFASSTSRTVHLNGSSGNQNTDSSNAGSLSFLKIGLRANTTDPFNGLIAEMAIYDKAITSSSSRNALANGDSPLLVESSELIGYWRMLDNYEDFVGSNNLSITGSVPTSGDHPAITMPSTGTFIGRRGFDGGFQ